MRARRAAFPVLLAAVLLTACGDEDEGLPAACQVQPAQVRAALSSAPGPVALDGTPISECFVELADAGDIQTVGGTMLAAAVPLAERARLEPEGDAAVRAGYLLGAVRRGARGKQGIYDEIVRRIDQEFAGLDRETEAFRRGQRAGLAGG